MKLDFQELDKLTEWFNKSNLSTATVEYNKEGEFKITLKKYTEYHPHTQIMHTGSYTPQTTSSDSLETQPKANTENLEEVSNTIKITSPIVGSFYRSPGPDSPPFAQIGTNLKKGQVLCILEAMKVMNELEAEFDMEIVNILVDNGSLVEFGQVLFEVKAV